jgi:deazaflavin-dependent oxidoreductase (nitroreductase family)
MPNRTAVRLQWRTHKLMWQLSGGRLGRRVVGMAVLELETTGHISGATRTILITYIDQSDGPVTFGTNAGLDRHPAWVLNLRKTPGARMRVNGQWTHRTAHEVSDTSERERLWALVVAAHSGYAAYLTRLTRPVPIIQLRLAT